MEASARELMLSHQSIGAQERTMPKSLNNILDHNSATVVMAIARYLDSMEERETITYFLALQET
jgi:hypothetical protein